MLLQMNRKCLCGVLNPSWHSQRYALLVSSFTIKDHAKVEFLSNKTLVFDSLELHYKAMLIGHSLSIISNDIQVHFAGDISLTGHGNGPGQGDGRGTPVSICHIVSLSLALYT